MNPENERIYQAFMKKLQTEIVFFMNTYENAVIKSIPETGFYVKFSGEDEFLAKNGSRLVTDGLLEYKEITEKEYNNF